MLRRFTVIVGTVGLAAGICTAPAGAVGSLAASYAITYYRDGTGATYATACVNFNVTSRSHGVVYGNWSSPSISGWSGQWLQKGEHFEWFGFYTSGNTVYETSDSGDFINATTATETSAIVNAQGSQGPLFNGTATLQAVRSCSGAPRLR